MKRIVLAFGLLAGAILSILMIATLPFAERIGFERGAVIGYTSMVAAFLLVFAGVRSYRDNVGGGSIGFGRAFAVGALIVAVASVCYTVTWRVISRTALPDFTERYQEYVLEKERAAGAGEEALAAKRAELERFAQLYDHPLLGAAITFIEPLPVGLVFALVAAGILRRGRDDASRPGEVAPSVAAS